jgi:hypothetical protein
MWKVIGASVTGTSHKAQGKDGQDASGWRSGPGVTCMAVADGAGSRPLSAAGSALAVERALATGRTRAAGAAESSPAADWIRAAFAEAHEQIAAMAASADREVAEYETTLALAILTADVVAIGQVGDSIAVVGEEGHYRTVAPEVKGEYVNETFFITAPDALAHLRVTVLPAREAELVVLSTDGLRYKILAGLAECVPFAPFFDDLASYIRTQEASSSGIAQFLSRLDSDQTRDDKTLVAAVRATSPITPEPGAVPRAGIDSQVPGP